MAPSTTLSATTRPRVTSYLHATAGATKTTPPGRGAKRGRSTALRWSTVVSGDPSVSIPLSAKYTSFRRSYISHDATRAADTHSPAHLRTAIKLADFWVRALQEIPDYVPNFDLTYKGLGPLSNLTNRDASAAAIAASGLVELAGYVNDSTSSSFFPVKAAKYLSYAEAAVTALSTSGGAYVSDFSVQEGAIKHCNAAETDVPWADYYLLEAIRRLRGRSPGTVVPSGQ